MKDAKKAGSCNKSIQSILAVARHGLPWLPSSLKERECRKCQQ